MKYKDLFQANKEKKKHKVIRNKKSKIEYKETNFCKNHELECVEEDIIDEDNEEHDTESFSNDDDSFQTDISATPDSSISSDNLKSLEEESGEV